MIIGEVCLQTNDVRRLADFYKGLLGVENNSDDDTRQFIISEETQLTIYNDGTKKNNQNENISLAFTVEDIEKEYSKVQALGAKFSRLWQIKREILPNILLRHVVSMLNE